MITNKSVSRVLCPVLLAAIVSGLLGGCAGGKAAAPSGADQQQSIAAVEAYVKSFGEASQYYSVLKQWTADKAAVPQVSYTITPEQLAGGVRKQASDSKGYGQPVAALEPKAELTAEVEVAESGLYELWMDYYVQPQSVLNPEFSLTVNGKTQYNEMNQLRLDMDWSSKKEEKKLDRYGDELMPQAEVFPQWKYKGLQDPNFFYTDPLKIYLDQGKNSLRLDMNEGYVLLGNLTLTNTQSAVPAYAEYRESAPQAGEAGKRYLVIEAEDMDLKSRQSIRAKYVRDPLVTPYSYKHRVLNVLDGYSYGEGGDQVSYRFQVKESGYYQLTLKYSQNTNNGMPTHRRISLDGEVPFKELLSYSFPYASDWKNETLQDAAGEPYRIYLSAGEHVLDLSVDNSAARTIYHELLSVLEAIDYTAQDINRLTGGIVDKERKWRIGKYMPEIVTYLEGISAKLEQQRLALIELTQDKSLPVITQLKQTQDLIRGFIKDPDDLPHYMSRFNEGESSAYAKIKGVLPVLISNPMHLDRIYLHEGQNLSAANAKMVKSAVENVKAFGYSFINPRYKRTSDEEAVEVWVNQSRLYVEIMQRMIDEDFTPQTGVKIDLSILPDENKIVLSNAAGSTPDAAIGVSNGRPFELALRGIIEDLKPHEGFSELAGQFNPNAFIPYIYDKGIYAIPETQSVKLLFYRKDILKFLGEEPPQTWDDVVGLVPVLQKYGMNFYTPLGSDNAYKGFDVTTPFIYQFGGKLYDETGTKTIINKDGAYEAFELMTNLFTVYNMPITTSEFFQSFRSSKTPVGIGDANTYIQLKYAAPELAGQWGVLPTPGVRNEAGTVERWDPSSSSSAILFKNSEKKEEAWKFLKWWTSADTQAAFSYQIQASLGNKFLYMTANLDGFAKSAWPADSKDVILEQWKWIQATGKVPGDYVLEREISNAWNNVVFSKQNPRVAVDKAVKIIDKELERKLKEFGYIQDGKLIKPYRVPTMENVENWVNENGK